MHKFLMFLSGFMPLRIIRIEATAYMERYYVGTWFGVTFYLHRFLTADSERHMHNHPWKRGGSLILSGSYLEEFVVDLCPWLPGGVVTESRRVRWFNSVNGSKFHRISDAAPNTWTLFWHGERQMVRVPANSGFRNALKGWGFLENAEFLDFAVGSKPTACTTFKPATFPTDLLWFEKVPRGKDNPERSA